MGSLHALHFLHRTPHAELVAAFSPCEQEIAWAQQHLEPYGVTLYMDYAEMLLHPGLEAVVIAVVNTKHAEQATKAIEPDKHVCCARNR
jgi:myo-inositol 2-dehydrogenase/D-chiro-inositol 1-dehydrogenase